MVPSFLGQGPSVGTDQPQFGLSRPWVSGQNQAAMSRLAAVQYCDVADGMPKSRHWSGLPQVVGSASGVDSSASSSSTVNTPSRSSR